MLMYCDLWPYSSKIEQYTGLLFATLRQFNMEAIPKSDIKSVIKTDIRFDISIKRTTWIGHEGVRLGIAGCHILVLTAASECESTKFCLKSMDQ